MFYTQWTHKESLETGFHYLSVSRLKMAIQTSRCRWRPRSSRMCFHSSATLQCSVKINVHLIKLDSTHSTYLSVSVISNRANECDTDAFQLLPLLLLLCFYDTWAVCWGAAVPDIAPVLCLLETSDNSRPFLTSQEPDSHEEVKCMNEWVDVRVGFMT